MAFGTASDPFVAVAVWASVAAFATCAALIAAVIVLRIVLLAATRRDARFERTWQDVFAAHAAEAVDAPPPALALADRERFLRLFNRYQGSVRGEARDRLNALAVRHGIDSFARDRLTIRNLQRRLAALRTVGYLRDAKSAPVLDTLVDDANPVVSLLAEIALLEIAGAAALPAFLRRAARREDWPQARLAAILKDRPPQEVSAPLAAAVREATVGPATGPGALRLIRLLECALPEDGQAVVSELLRNDDPEVLAAALRQVRDPAALPRVRELASHPEWFVRVEAAKALVVLGLPQDRYLLLRMLADPSWWVRYRAAQALAELRECDGVYLRQVRRLLADPYAADMLGQVIAERNG